MRCRLLCLAPLALSALAQAQPGLSQARLEDDCLQRLRPIIPRGITMQRVDFSALGNYASYYVVTYRFPGGLRNGSRTAACTYRRSGEWVKDDAATFQLLQELDASRGRSPTR